MCFCRIFEYFVVIKKSYLQDGQSWVSINYRLKGMNDEDIQKMIKDIEEDHTEDFVKKRKIDIIHQIKGVVVPYVMQ